MTFGGQQSGQPPVGDQGAEWDAYPPGQAQAPYPPHTGQSPYAEPSQPSHPGYAPQPSYPGQPGFAGGQPSYAAQHYPAQPHPAQPYQAQPGYPAQYGYAGPQPGQPGPYGFPSAGPPPGCAGQGYGRPAHYTRRGVRGLGILLVVVGVLGVIGSIAPWAWVRLSRSAYRFSDLDYSATGLDGGGTITLALRAAVAIMGAILIQRTLLGLSITALTCGSVTALIGLLNLASINTAADEVRILTSGDAGPAWGLWLVIVSGAISAVGGLVALLRGRWIDPFVEAPSPSR